MRIYGQTGKLLKSKNNRKNNQMPLSFGKPKKVDHGANSGGLYVQNMSVTDQNKWKAKRIGGKDPRIEIRKSVSGFDPILAEQSAKRGWNQGSGKRNNCHAQVLAIVRPNGNVVLSANGRMAFDRKVWNELFLCVEEAGELLTPKEETK